MDVCWGYRLPCDSCPCCAVAARGLSMPLRFRSIAGPCDAVAVLSFAVPPRFFALPCRFNALTRFSLTPRCARSFAAAFRSLHSHSLPLLLIAGTAPLLCSVALSFRAMPSLGSSVPCLCRACPCHAFATPCPALLRNSDPFLLASVLCNSSAPPRRSLQCLCYSVIACHFRSRSLPGQSLLCHSSALRGLTVPFPIDVRLCLAIPQLRRSVRFLSLPCPFFAISMLVLALPSHLWTTQCLRSSELIYAFAFLNYSMPSLGRACLPMQCHCGSRLFPVPSARSYSVSCLSNAFSVNG